MAPKEILSTGIPFIKEDSTWSNRQNSLCVRLTSKYVCTPQTYVPLTEFSEGFSVTRDMIRLPLIIGTNPIFHPRGLKKTVMKRFAEGYNAALGIEPTKLQL